MIYSFGAFLIAALGGFLLGVIYFAWLWRSVSGLASAKQIQASFVMGAVLRLTALAALVGILLLLKTAPSLLLVGVFAFFVARLLMTTVLGRAAFEA